jgi:hypothetical protein
MFSKSQNTAMLVTSGVLGMMESGRFAAGSLKTALTLVVCNG